MSEPLKFRLNPELVAAAEEFNRQVAAIDWDRIGRALLYALFNGGNLPPGFMDEPQSNAEPLSSPSEPPYVGGEAGEAQEGSR